MDWKWNLHSLEDCESILPFRFGEHIPDDWKLIMAKKEINTHIKTIARILNEKYKNKRVVLVCVLKGGAWFMTKLSNYLEFDYSTYFIEASSYKNSQSQSEIEISGCFDSFNSFDSFDSFDPLQFENREIVLLDELYDKGTTIKTIKSKITELTQKPVFTCVLFKKRLFESTESTEKIESVDSVDCFGVTVPNVWLVGFGLDDKQTKRGLPHLFAVPKTNAKEKTADDYKIFRKN